MSTDTGGRLQAIEAGGSPFDIGMALGRFGADIAHRHLVRRHAWASVMRHRDDERVIAMRETVEARFPAIWQELRGLADGLGLPLADVFAWNCRGDVWAMAPDGCTTVQVPGAEPVVAHNEDGDPAMRGHCALAHVRPAQGQAFTAFVYPGSLPGHTFAATAAGLVQAVNNIRSHRAGPGMPRMVLGRALLDCATLDEALNLLRTSARAGAFHMTLAQRGDPRAFSVEFTHSACSIHLVTGPACHANHLIHDSTAAEPQEVTGSSAARQRRGDAIISQAPAGRALDPLAVLWDRGNPALPVLRTQPDDPDYENTLATAIFHVGRSALRWRVWDRAEPSPRFVFEDNHVPREPEGEVLP